MEKELIALIRFLAKGLMQLESEILQSFAIKDDEEFRDYIIFKTSRTQGMQTQNDLTKIGNIKYNETDLRDAVDYILSIDCETKESENIQLSGIEYNPPGSKVERYIDKDD
jgi:hypothetical protein